MAKVLSVDKLLLINHLYKGLTVINQSHYHILIYFIESNCCKHTLDFNWPKKVKVKQIKGTLQELYCFVIVL